MLGIVCVVSTAVDGLAKELAILCVSGLLALYCGNEINVWLCA